MPPLPPAPAAARSIVETERKNSLMRRFLFFLIALLTPACCTLRAQTVIDLGRGGGIRSKTLDDYKIEHKTPRETALDSLAYNDCLTRAFNELHRDSLTLAERYFRQALKLQPNAVGNRVIRHNLGLIEMARGDLRAAIATFTDVLHEDPEDYATRLDRAKAYLELGNAPGAVEDCNVLLKAADTDSARKELYFLSGAAKMQMRLYADARKDLERVLAWEPGNGNAIVLLSMAFERDGQPQEAVNRLNLLLQVQPGNLDARLARAGVEARLGLDAAAREDYDAVLAALPDAADVYVERARVLIRLGLKGAARKDLDRARQLGIPTAAVQHLYPQTQ